MQVLPVLNCDTYQCVVDRVRKAKDFSEWVHIDVPDGKFTPTVLWNNPAEFEKIKKDNPDVKFEIHLMVENPESVIDAWLRDGASRVIVHLETMTDSVYILEKCKKYGAEAMLAIGPKTDVERLLAHEHDFKYFQILAVFPGLQGQKFQESALEKIKFIREKMPGAIIEVDGGMNLETAKMVKKAGADIIVSASYIFDNSNCARAFNKLKNV